MPKRPDRDNMTHIQVPHQNPPSPWVVQFAEYVPMGPVLDLACGAGRHGRYFLQAGYPVTFIDQDIARVGDLRDNPSAQIVQYDLENGSPWPFSNELFSGIIVVNYLYRPLFRHLLKSLKSGGVLIYQTFAQGNERYGRPRNPDFLLQPNELSDYFAGAMKVIAFEQGFMPDPDRVVQSICAVNTRVI